MDCPTTSGRRTQLGDAIFRMNLRSRIGIRRAYPRLGPVNKTSFRRGKSRYFVSGEEGAQARFASHANTLARAPSSASLGLVNSAHRECARVMANVSSVAMRLLSPAEPVFERPRTRNLTPIVLRVAPMSSHCCRGPLCGRCHYQSAAVKASSHGPAFRQAVARALRAAIACDRRRRWEP
jgi:hypothetical protein